MFRRILIANRGEIACRIARTARAMGVETVAVHSDADAAAAHVRACDQAVAIGPAPAQGSYLRGDRIIAAALATGAQAIHPGYGFLSENPEFAEAVVAAGLVFIGPPAAAIRAMGLKDAAKARMAAAGVPITPGYHGADQTDLAAQADRIGYPLLIKAVAGGGGRGMRAVQAPGDFAAALAQAQAEAQAAFGNPAVLLERLIPNPRHIEVQVFADGHGNVVHLFERDCSLQRRHQKVVEEAPAPGMTADLRAAMTEAATRAARAVGYQGAGTVEFIVDGTDMTPSGFWFMEMNTRLQVEHPVTEAITGLDLVAWQLRVAAGEPLPLTQDRIVLTGHALEVRLYAEDPAQGFRPATGQLDRLTLAPGLARVDSGMRPGDPVTPHYDAMIAKLVTHGSDRAAAFAAMGRALAASDVQGPACNLGFVERLIGQADVLAGRLDTGLIGREIAALTAPPVPRAADLALAAAALVGLLAPPPLAGWRAWGPGITPVVLAGHGTVALTPRPGGIDAATPLGPVSLDLTALGGTAWAVGCEGQTDTLHLHPGPGRVTLARDGLRLAFALADPLATAVVADAGGDTVRAPLPGLLTALPCPPGTRVARGDTLAVLEAMKMQHALTAPRDGTVATLGAAPGDQVEEGRILVTLDPTP